MMVSKGKGREKEVKRKRKQSEKGSKEMSERSGR
jgi:hypothetical protein